MAFTNRFQRQTYSRKRPLWRTLIDAFVFAVAAWMVILTLDKIGLTNLGPSRYRVADGDSLERGGLRLRLYGIDAPELSQTCKDGQGTEYPCGTQARDALRDMVYGKDVTCKGRGEDKFGRLLAVCNADGAEINTEMVRQGWAVAFSAHSVRYVLAERDARKNQRGIWWGEFEQPREYRDRQRSITKGSIVELDVADDD
jgi:endonuclease YncB( thermonuclease family)